LNPNSIETREVSNSETMTESLSQVLVIDPDSAHIQRMTDALKHCEEPAFHAGYAESLVQGLERLASTEWAAVLLSPQLADYGGLTAVTEVHSHFRALPIVVLVSKEEEALGRQALRAGACEYLIRETLSVELLHKALRYAIGRKQAEEAVRRSEDRFRELFESAKDILFTFDLEGNIISLNKSAEEVLGWPREDLLKRNIKNLVAPEHLGICSQMMQRVLTEEFLQNVEINLIRKDGRRVLLETTARLIHSDGKKIGVQGIARDVTERRHLENMLQQSQKLEAVGRLSGGVAHDFNNLLCVISGHTDLLMERAEPTGPALRSLTQIKKAVESAASLTRQLLTFSRKQLFHPRVLDLNLTVVETEKLLGRLIGEHIELVATLDPALGHVLADPFQVEQVLVNLVLNARDAMPQGGKLTIETSNADLEETNPTRRSMVPPGKYVLLAVTDTGVGMSPETQSRIFEPFFTTKAFGEGTGLGLATVYGIVKQSGGFIWVYSEQGCGTRFKIYFPREDRPLTPSLSSNFCLDSCRGTETVLLVEDAEPLRALIREFLADSGYTILDAGNGSDATRIGQQHDGPIHLLLSDVVMPGIGGMQLAEQMKALRPQIRVLYMSGYPNDGIVQSGVLGTGVALLEKPFTRDTLLQKVRNVLDVATRD
jgi:PAS domain S-box-containing protein